MKKFVAVQKVLGLLLMVFSVTMLPPALVSVLYGDGAGMPFVYAFAVILGVGTLIWLPVATKHQELRLRDGFLVVVLFWVVLGLSGALAVLDLASARPVADGLHLRVPVRSHHDRRDGDPRHR